MQRVLDSVHYTSCCTLPVLASPLVLVSRQDQVQYLQIAHSKLFQFNYLDAKYKSVPIPIAIGIIGIISLSIIGRNEFASSEIHFLPELYL